MRDLIPPKGTVTYYGLPRVLYSRSSQLKFLSNFGSRQATPVGWPIDLEEIATNTKISIRFLRAIELEEFEKLPGGIFSTSYLRQYAAAIAYDQDALVAHYRQKMNLPSESVKEAAPDTASRTRLDRWFKMPAQARQL